MIDTLNRAINEILSNEEITARFAKLGLEPQIASTAEFATLVAEAAPRWAKIVEMTGIKLK